MALRSTGNLPVPIGPVVLCFRAHGLRASGFRLQLQTSNSKLQVSTLEFRLQTSNSKLQVSTLEFKVQSSNFKLQVSTLEFRLQTSSFNFKLRTPGLKFRLWALGQPEARAPATGVPDPRGSHLVRESRESRGARESLGIQESPPAREPVTQRGYVLV